MKEDDFRYLLEKKICEVLEPLKFSIEKCVPGEFEAHFIGPNRTMRLTVNTVNHVTLLWYEDAGEIRIKYPANETGRYEQKMFLQDICKQQSFDNNDYISCIFRGGD